MHFSEDDYEDLKNRDVVLLSREGLCHMACKMIFDELGEGAPYVILREGIPNTYAHYFLKIDDKAVDMGGVFTMNEMLAFFPGDGPMIETSWRKLKEHRENVSEEEWEYVTDRFISHIQSNKQEWIRKIKGA